MLILIGTPKIRHGKEEHFLWNEQKSCPRSWPSWRMWQRSRRRMYDLDLSSMEILTIVADLEETFGLRIPEKELRNFVTISDLADYLAANAG